MFRITKLIPLREGAFSNDAWNLVVSGPDNETRFPRGLSTGVMRNPLFPP